MDPMDKKTVSIQVLPIGIFSLRQKLAPFRAGKSNSSALPEVLVFSKFPNSAGSSSFPREKKVGYEKMNLICS